MPCRCRNGALTGARTHATAPVFRQDDRLHNPGHVGRDHQSSGAPTCSSLLNACSCHAHPTTGQPTLLWCRGCRLPSTLPPAPRPLPQLVRILTDPSDNSKPESVVIQRYSTASSSVVQLAKYKVVPLPGKSPGGPRLWERACWQLCCSHGWASRACTGPGALAALDMSPSWMLCTCAGPATFTNLQPPMPPAVSLLMRPCRIVADKHCRSEPLVLMSAPRSWPLPTVVPTASLPRHGLQPSPPPPFPPGAGGAVDAAESVDVTTRCPISGFVIDNIINPKYGCVTGNSTVSYR